MPSIPSTIPELGSTSQALRANPAFDPRTQTSLTTRDYYVFSRIDGTTSLRDLILMVGLDPDETIGIVRKLREVGAVLLPGDGEGPRPAPAAADGVPTSAPAAADGVPTSAPAAADGVPSVASPEVTGAWTLKDRAEGADGSGEGVPEDELTDEEQRALAEDGAIAHEDRRHILEMRRIVARGDLFEVLGVSAQADKRAVKRAYFRLSKEFHPDRFFGVDTGTFGPWLAQIFETVSRAYAVLSSSRKRAAYEATLRGEARAQTREEHADQLFREGAEKEARGDLDDALKLFEASIRAHQSVASIRRAAACALRAERFDLAASYARRAAAARPEDPSLQRLLAAIHRAKGDLARAEAILVRALELKSASDVLAKELAADLASVRAARGDDVDSA